MNIDVAREAAFTHTRMPVLATGSQTLYKAGLPSVILVPMFNLYRKTLFNNLLYLKKKPRTSSFSTHGTFSTQDLELATTK